MFQYGNPFDTEEGKLIINITTGTTLEKEEQDFFELHFVGKDYFLQ